MQTFSSWCDDVTFFDVIKAVKPILKKLAVV